MPRVPLIALVVLSIAGPVPAQQLPGRDLFEFPLGSIAEGTALALQTGDGFRNPASILLARDERARLSVSSLLTGAQQSVSGQVVAAAIQLRGHTLGVSVARASVDGIARTEGDPQSIGGDVPYDALVVSLVGATRRSRNLSGGLAVRWLRGELDLTTRNELGLDAGVVGEHLTPADVRVGATSFFWRPGSRSGDGVTLSLSIDGRVLGRDPLRTVRAGYAFATTPGISTEHYVFTSARWQAVEARTGIARTSAFTHASARWRLALGVHVDRYFAAISRDDNPSGLAASYQFTLTRAISRL